MVILSLQTILGSLPKRYKGTTPDLREIIIGRCWDYQRLTIENPYENEDLRVDVDCDEVWKVLNETLAYKDPCKITTKSYDKFFNLIDNGKDLKDQVCFVRVVYECFKLSDLNTRLKGVKVVQSPFSLLYLSV